MFEDANVDPSSTPEPAAPTETAPTTPTPTGQEQQPPFHLHPRFQQVTRENRELRGTVGQLNNRLSQLERSAQQHGGATPAEQKEYQDAASALRKVIAADPELAEWFESRKRLPQLAQGVQGVQQLQAQAAQARLGQARSHIEQLVKGANLSVDPKQMGHVVRLVAGAAMNQQDGNERYERGDMSVLTEAFADVKSFLEGFTKAGVAGVAQTKNKTKTLPPAPRGGAAGPAATPAPKQGEERAFQSNMHKRGLEMLKEKFTG